MEFIGDAQEERPGSDRRRRQKGRITGGNFVIRYNLFTDIVVHYNYYITT